MVRVLVAILLAAAPLRAAPPTLTPAPGSYTGTQTVQVRSKTPGAVVYCTTDGSAPRPAASRRVAGNLTVASSSTVRCRAYAARRSPSLEVSGSYMISAAPAYCAQLVHDTTAHAASALSKPAYLDPVIDPEFGTRITRVTGDVGTAVGSMSETWSDMAYSIYPKLAAWSAPDAQGHSILSIDYTHQTGHAPIFLDGDTYQPLWVKGGRYAANVFDRRWHPVLPETAVEVDQTTGDIRFWNVRSDTKVTVYTGGLNSAAQVAFGPGEGNISQDGRWVVVTVGSGTSGPPYFFVVDMTACMPTPTAGCAVKRTSDITISAVGISSLDWASMSPKGTYLVVSRNYQETAVLDWNQSTGAVTTTRRAQFASGHYDMTVGVDGTEYAQAGNGYAYRLSDGVRSTIWATGAGAYHAGSVRLGQLGGWIVASDEDAGSPATGELVAFGVGGEFYRLAHHRAMSVSDGPHAVPSPDGKRVFFGSNWGTEGGPIQGYVVDVRNLCP